MKLGELFDAKSNGLNSIRLIMAVGVIVYHSFPITGTVIAYGPVHQLLGQIFVDAFFAISGYLIVGSWVRRPQFFEYILARVLRIMPAYYVCLLVTGFIFVPVYLLLTQGSWTSWLSDSAEYVRSNFALWQNQYNIGSTLGEVPYPNVWNGSLWTLAWEFLCYLGVLALGLTRLLSKRICLVLFVACLATSCLVTFTEVSHFWLNNGSRFGLMFLAGALIYFYQDRLVATRAALIAASIVVCGSMFLPDYRIIAALPLAYSCITLGGFLKHSIFRLKNDISYGVYIYAFPIQQLLAVTGFYAAGVGPFAIVAMIITICFATGSWFAIEKPANNLRRRIGKRRASPTLA
ncbi:MULTISPECIES: acyltransferase family protein [Micrococcaceae]|uniref:acyltransferase family protein n=1 Tax=Micrococcaceae TaxID=1268 RepID=UPI000BB91AFA|nr:acyltransferase [Glutamicibacter sp. BW78]PCC25762.1 hypothetical protein CIK75_04565 [Glutamicibacter sp. BW78]